MSCRLVVYQTGPSPAQGKHVIPAERDPQGHASQPGTLIGSGPLQDTEASPEIGMNVTLLRRALKNPQPSVTFVSDHKTEYWQVSDPCGLDTKESRKDPVRPSVKKTASG